MEINAGRKFSNLLTAEEMMEVTGTRFYTNQEACTIASWYASSGVVGDKLAQLATTGRVDAQELLDDIVLTIIKTHNDAGNLIRSSDEALQAHRELCMLYAWVIYKIEQEKFVTGFDAKWHE
jgi:hypothetical protein